jgi:hypothetical protein
MSEIKSAIRSLVSNDDEVYSIVGFVTKVDKKRKVVNVQPLNDDAELFGVRLQANESDTEGVVIFPKKGSNVTVTFLNKNTGYVAQFSEIESVEWKVGTLKSVVNTEGVHIENKGSDLKKVVDAIIENQDKTFDFLIKLKVVTPAGIGTLSPEIITQVTIEKQKLAVLKNQIAQILT